MNRIPVDLAQHISTYLCVQDAAEIRKTAKVFSSYGWEQWINSCVKNYARKWPGLSPWPGLVALAHVARSETLNDALMACGVSEYLYLVGVDHRDVSVVESLLEPWIAKTHIRGYWVEEWLHFAAVCRLENTCRLLVHRKKAGQSRAIVDRVLELTLSVGDIGASDLLWKYLSEAERRATAQSRVFSSLLRPHVSLQVMRSGLEWMKVNQYVCYAPERDVLALDIERRAAIVEIGDPSWSMPQLLLNAPTI